MLPCAQGPRSSRLPALTQLTHVIERAFDCKLIQVAAKSCLRARVGCGRVLLVSKELPAISDTPCQPPPEGGEYVYRLDVPKLREAIHAHGDNTGAAIFRRTGIAESSVSRILRGEAQPDLNSAMRLSEAYNLDLREVIKRIPIEAAA